MGGSGIPGPRLAKHKQLFRKRIVLQGLFHQNSQTINALAKVNDISAQVNSRQFV